MEFSIATLLAQFSDNKLVAPKVLEKRLDCQDEECGKKLQIVLDILEKLGVLVKERGKYRRQYEDDVVEAKLRCSSKGFCFAIQDVEGAEDVYIRESNLSNAWNGDRVLVKILKEGSRRRSPEGEVKVILDRANPSLLARVKETEEGYRAVPLDDRLLFELMLKQQTEELKEALDHLVHVEVLRYPLGKHLPLGRVTKVLGSDAEAAADTDIVSCKHDLPQSFPKDVLEAAEKLSFAITEDDIAQRQDLRYWMTLTIESDSETEETPFMENAFTLQKTREGHWRIGIHWVDVAHFIEPRTALDQEARKRGTAVHLAELVLPLLPETVLNQLSLVPDEDRLTLTIFLTIDETGELVEFDIQPSVIRVDHAFTYAQAQSLLGRQQDVDDEFSAAVEILNELFFTIAPKVKARRQQRGSFEVETFDRQLPYKDEGRLGAIAVSPSLPVRSLLAEFAILAGEAIASHFQALAIPGIYCIQSEPDYEELEDLLKLGNNIGLNLELEEEEEISPQDYQRFTQVFSKSSASKVLMYLLKSTLRSVKYSTKPGFHFGLAYSNGYTHCLSPAQRYSDLLVQRILKTVFEQGRDRRSSRTKEGVNLGSSTSHGKINWNVLPTQTQSDLEENLGSIVLHLNERDKIAEDAESDLEGLQKAEKMKERTGQVFQGLITGVQSYGFFVEIEDLLVEGLVHVSSLKDDWYEYRARHSCLVGRKNRIAYRLGDRVEVEVKSVDYYRQQIDLVAKGGGSSARNEDWEDS
ncbi:MAG: ribonuclease R family protein [Cyanobacteriota bacterium]